MYSIPNRYVSPNDKSVNARDKSRNAKRAEYIFYRQTINVHQRLSSKYFLRDYGERKREREGDIGNI
jgi:hypothetical protein